MIRGSSFVQNELMYKRILLDSSIGSQKLIARGILVFFPTGREIFQTARIK
jgi:hypothetical protein